MALVIQPAGANSSCPSSLRGSLSILPLTSLPAVQDLGVAPVAPAQRVQRMQQAAVDWVKINPVLAAGAVALVPLLWLVLRRAAIAGECNVDVSNGLVSVLCRITG